MYSVLSLLMLLALRPATHVAFKTVDASGAPVKDELVIVQDLNGRTHEILRALTDTSGQVESLELARGLYRLIATDPYGLWQTKVSEFLVTGQPTTLVVSLDSIPTHGQGDVVTLASTSIEVEVLDAEGRSAVGAKILSRDETASLASQKWYLTDQDGRANIRLAGDPTVVVVWFGDVLLTREIGSKESRLLIRLPKS
jgi:hypothetical protein